MEKSKKKIVVKLSIISFLILFIATFVFAFWSEIETAYDVYLLSQSAEMKQVQRNCQSLNLKDLECDFQQLQSAAEEALVWRSLSLKFYDQIKLQKDLGQPLSSKQVTYLHEGTQNYLPIRNRLLYFAYKNREPVKWDLSEDEINDRITKDKTFVRRSKIALAAALTLYDNFLIGIYPYSEAGEFRRLINTDMAEVRNALEAATRNFHSRFHSQRIGRAIRIYEVAAQRSAQELSWQDFYLDSLIQSSPSYHWLKSQSELGMMARNANWFVNMLTDRIFELQKFALHNLSGVFGNAVGLVEFRKGKLYGNTNLEIRLSQELKPLDILLEKTPFRLTDMMIPGHWGHAAVWLGSEQELKDLGIWEDPLVAPHHESIRHGAKVLEALRSGVQINSLAHFLNVDDLAVLRVEGLSDEQKRQFLLKAFAQIGKAYDFNFDVETDARIVCSELVYVVFEEGFNWPTSKALGRATISPDEVAKISLTDGRFVPLILFREGIELTGDLKTEMQKLVAEGSQSGTKSE